MSKALTGNNKTFDDVMTMTFYDVIFYLGSVRVRVEKSKSLELRCFSSSLVEIWQ